MSIRRILALGLVAAAVTACSDDDPTGASDGGPKAYVRVINVMPDTGKIDFRYVDKVENTTGYGLSFGQASNYDRVGAGARQMKVFRNSPTLDIAVASQVVATDELTFEAQKYYTILLGGRRDDNAGTLTLVSDDSTAIPAEAAGKFQLRAYNVSGQALDVYRRSGTTALPGTALVTGLANNTSSSWVTLDTASVVKVAAFAPGTTTPALTDAQVTAGTTGSTTVNPVAGSRSSGAALTAFILPPCTAGSAATSTSNVPNNRCTAANRANPTILYLVDRLATPTAP
ncbi:MAG: DUF4397 domain-containing protein [Gemmatimonadaceae bacterium]